MVRKLCQLKVYLHNMTHLFVFVVTLQHVGGCEAFVVILQNVLGGWVYVGGLFWLFCWFVFCICCCLLLLFFGGSGICIMLFVGFV